MRGMIQLVLINGMSAFTAVVVFYVQSAKYKITVKVAKRSVELKISRINAISLVRAFLQHLDTRLNPITGARRIEEARKH